MALSIFKILGEALKLCTKNPKLVLPLQLLYFVSNSVLFCITYLFITPLTADITTKSLAIASLDPNSPEYASLTASILKDVKEVAGIQILLLFVSVVVNALWSFATIHVFSLSYAREFLNLNNLLRRLVKNLKGPTITRLYVLLLNFGLMLLFVLLIGSTWLIFRSSSTVFLAILLLLVVVFVHVYLYLSMVWNVGVVVSVVEEEGGCYGLAAISRAAETTKGRRKQGGLLNLVLFLMAAIVSGIYNFGILYVKKNKDDKDSTMEQLGLGLVYVAACVFAGLYQWAVFMVFYCDCKKRKGEEGISRMMGNNSGRFVYKVIVEDDQEIP